MKYTWKEQFEIIPFAHKAVALARERLNYAPEYVLALKRIPTRDISTLVLDNVHAGTKAGLSEDQVLAEIVEQLFQRARDEAVEDDPEALTECTRDW
jgi:hypothetical protein